MPAKWPVGMKFEEKVLRVEATRCHVCGWPLNYRTNRLHCVYTLRGPLRLTCKLSSCWNPRCSEYEVLRNPEAERLLTMPRWRIGWDVLLWMGYRRCKRHWSIPQIQAELEDSYQIHLSEKMLTAYVQKYQVMVAAWYQDVARLKMLYQESPDLILTIDGIQPEKGHETLYVVRELRQQRVWFAESLLSSSNAEIRKLIQRAKQLVQVLDKPVCGWMSDKQAAFVTTIAEEFPGIAHRYCANHFLRDVAQLVVDLDSHAKVQMRKKIRGLRSLEQAALAESDQPRSTPSLFTPAQRQVAAQIVLDYCAAVRGVLNDNHGGPLRPAGWRMAEALEAIEHSLERNLRQPPTPIRPQLAKLQGYIQRGLALYAQDKPRIAGYLATVQQIWHTLCPEQGTRDARLATFRQLRQQLADTEDPITLHMSQVMQSFEPGLFVGSPELDLPQDNLDLERWIRGPKGHERRIHGHQHVGRRMIVEGATLLPALDAHIQREEPFTVHDLLPYAHVEIPASQQQAVTRHKAMKQARSKKNESRFWSN